MHHHGRSDFEFADLTSRELDKIIEIEKLLNSQQNNRDEEIIILAYKKKQQ